MCVLLPPQRDSFTYFHNPHLTFFTQICLGTYYGVFFIFIMASKQSKQHKKDPKLKASVDDDAELSMASIAKLLKQNRQAFS